jgi:DNA-binding NarL/FixJ family response regulator
LEKASGKADADFCVSNSPDLLEGLDNLSASLIDAFELLKQSQETIRIPAELPPILQRLVDAFDAVDLVLIDTMLESIKALNLTGVLKDEMEQIKDAVMMMDYDGATEQIRQLMEATAYG